MSGGRRRLGRLLLRDLGLRRLHQGAAERGVAPQHLHGGRGIDPEAEADQDAEEQNDQLDLAPIPAGDAVHRVIEPDAEILLGLVEIPLRLVHQGQEGALDARVRELLDRRAELVRRGGEAAVQGVEQRHHEGAGGDVGRLALPPEDDVLLHQSLDEMMIVELLRQVRSQQVLETFLERPRAEGEERGDPLVDRRADEGEQRIDHHHADGDVQQCQVHAILLEQRPALGSFAGIILWGARGAARYHGRSTRRGPHSPGPSLPASPPSRRERGEKSQTTTRFLLLAFPPSSPVRRGGGREKRAGVMRVNRSGSVKCPGIEIPFPP